MNRHDSQTLIGMSTDALKDHYEQVKSDYVAKTGTDGRTQVYLMTVNSYVQMKEEEDKIKQEKEGNE
jgi:hypothetical protein